MTGLAYPRPALAALLGAALLAGAAAVVAAPASEQLPAPTSAIGIAIAAVVLTTAFAAGLVRPVEGLFAVLLAAVLEGGFRRWAHNDVTVFLVKDFLLLGVYGAVLPRLRREHVRLAWWLVAPLAALLLLAVLHVPVAGTAAEAAIGLRSYVLYVPLLVVAPVLLAGGRALAFLVALLGLAVAQSVLAAVQALAGPGPLNRLVSGAEPGTVVVQGAEYLRPAGTFMHVGSLAAFVAVGLVAAFALAVGLRRGPAVTAALLAPGLLLWGAVYAGARALLATTLLVAVAFALGLLASRRLVHLAAAAAATAVALVGLVTVAPLLGALVDGALDRVTDPVRERVVLPRYEEEGTVVLRLDPAELPPPGSTSRRIVAAEDEAGREVVVSITRDREVASVVPEHERAPATAFVSRATDPSAGDERGAFRTRIAPAFELAADQGLVGHGTGSMTLGSAYAGYVSKLAWELGLPGLVLFAWLYAALGITALLGVRRGRGVARAAALAGAALLVVLVPWLLVTFVLDYPAVAVATWTLAGLAAAAAAADPRPAARAET